MMSRWFQPSKQGPSTRKMSMKDTALTVCTWILSTRKVSATSFSRDRRALRNMTPQKGSANPENRPLLPGRTTSPGIMPFRRIEGVFERRELIFRLA